MGRRAAHPAERIHDRDVEAVSQSAKVHLRPERPDSISPMPKV
jgi:hypothetical protein